MPSHASPLTPPSTSTTSTASTPRHTRTSRVVVSTVTLSLATALTLSLAPAAPAAPSTDINPANSVSAAPKATKKHDVKAGKHRHHDHAVLSHAEDSGEVDPAYMAAAAAYAVHGEASLGTSFKTSAMASTVDTDADGLIDTIDPDDDNDGIIDELDPDRNGNGILDVDETTPTTPTTDPTDDDDDVPVTPATIERYGSYQSQVSCNPVTMGGVAKLRSLFMSTYGGRDLGVVRNCSIGGLSEHKEGRAWDWGINFYNAHEKAQATKALDWLLATVDGEPHARARRVGIMYIIRNRQIWRAYNPSAGWQKYTGPNPHTDHVHFSFTWNGGSGAVSQWTGKVHAVDYGPCPPSKGKMASPWKAPNPYPCGTKPPTTPVPPTTTVPIGTGVSGNNFYKVTAGDKVPTVAAKSGLKGWKLRRWNGLPRGGNKTLPVGRWMQVAKVPAGVIVPGFYKVVTGDTLPAVSVKADTKGWRIRRRNGWAKSGKVTLLPGQWLQVRKVSTVNVRR